MRVKRQSRKNRKNKKNRNPINEAPIVETTTSCQYRIYAFIHALDEKDKWLSSFIQRLELGSIFEIFMLIPIILYSFIGIALLVAAYTIYFQSIFYFLTSFACLIINELLKRAIKRERPCSEVIAYRLFNLEG